MKKRSFTVDGTAFSARPITLGQMRTHEAALAALAEPSAKPFAQMAALLPLFAEALGIEEREAGEIINLDNFGAFAKAILGGGAPGEQEPAAQTGN